MESDEDGADVTILENKSATCLVSPAGFLTEIDLFQETFCTPVSESWKTTIGARSLNAMTNFYAFFEKITKYNRKLHAL